MLTCYIVSYDIADTKRLRRVHRAMKGFGDALQYSVFRCALSDSGRVLLKETLLPLLNQREDQVLLIDIGPASGRAMRCIESLGKAPDWAKMEQMAVIV